MPRFPSLRRSVAAPAAIAVAAAAVLLTTAPTAGARTAPTAEAGRYHHTWATDVNVRVSGVAASSGRALGPYSVTAYETVNIRSAPNTSSRAFDKIRAGETRSDALCWTHGETVRDHGYTNDVWIGFTEGWASAVYLKGNEYAGLPADATC